MTGEMLAINTSDLSDLIADVVCDGFASKGFVRPDRHSQMVKEMSDEVASSVVAVLEEASTYEARLRNPDQIIARTARARASGARLAEAVDGGTYLFNKSVQLPRALLILLMTTIMNVTVASIGAVAPDAEPMLVSSAIFVTLAEALAGAVADGIRDYFFEPDLAPHEWCVYRTVKERVDSGQVAMDGSFGLTDVWGWFELVDCRQKVHLAEGCAFSTDAERCDLMSIIDEQDLRLVLQSLCAKGFLIHGVGELGEYQIADVVQEESNGLG